MQKEIFEALVGDRVTASIDQDKVAMTVTEVSALNRSGEAQREPFSVLLRGPSEPLIEQGIYRIDLGQSGQQDLFMVPLGPKGDGIEYELIFN